MKPNPLFSLTHFHVGLAIFLLSGCAAGPDYKKPLIKAPAHFKESEQRWKVAEPQAEIDRGSWWKVFQDPRLNNLMTQLESSNQNIALMEANYRQALAFIAQAQANYAPNITASLSTARQKTGLTHKEVGQPLNQHSILVSASWEPGLWGSISRLVEAQKAGAEATAAQLAAIKLSLQAALVQTYFQLCTYDDLQKLLDASILCHTHRLTLLQRRYQAGIESRAALIQAESKLKDAQVQALENQSLRAQYEHALAVILGKMPADFDFPPMTHSLIAPPVPELLPSNLLERRPDIAQAERLVAQANAQIGVEMSAFYPNLLLGASGGFSSFSFAQWISSPARVWSLGPELAASLFDGGARKARVSATQAKYDASVAAYKQTVLAAFQEVEDQMSLLKNLTKESTLQTEKAASLQHAFALAQNNYKAGTIAHTDLLNAQLDFYAVEKNKLETINRQVLTTIALIKALGGGWKVGDLKKP